MAKKNTQNLTDVADTQTNSDKLKQLIQSYLHPKEIQWVQTEIIPFNLLLGNGIPRGRIIEILGSESVGKSLLSWYLVKAFQKVGGIAVFCDTETTFPLEFAKSLGVNTDELIYLNSVTVEEMEKDLNEIVNELRAVTEAPILWVVDSISALSSESEFEEDKNEQGDRVLKDKQQPARQAASLSNFFRHNNKMLFQKDITFVALSQLRTKLGVLYGKPTESPGGLALKHYASVRIEINKGKKEKDSNDDVSGVFAHANLVKSKVCQPFRKVELRINNGTGYDPMYGIEDILVASKRISQKDLKNYKCGEDVFAKKDVNEYALNHPEILHAWY